MLSTSHLPPPVPGHALPTRKAAAEAARVGRRRQQRTTNGKLTLVWKLTDGGVSGYPLPACIASDTIRESTAEFIGPRMVHCQSLMYMSSDVTSPRLTVMSPTPFSAFSSSASSLKLRGTMTTSPECPAMVAEAERERLRRGCGRAQRVRLCSLAQGGRWQRACAGWPTAHAEETGLGTCCARGRAGAVPFCTYAAQVLRSWRRNGQEREFCELW